MDPLKYKGALLECLILILVCVMGYVIGAIPTGYFFCKFFFGIDITQYGSGNIGASNVARVLGKKYFILIALIDALKAYCLLLLGKSFLISCAFSAWYLYAMMGGLLIGNAYSVFLNFKGGKGVATVLGIMLFALPLVVVGLFISFWGAVLALTKQPFIASLVSIGVILAALLMYGQLEQIALVVLIAIWLLWRHQANISVYLKTFKN